MARSLAMCSAPVISEVSPNTPWMPLGISLSYMLPTVGHEARPGGGVALAALGRHPQVANPTLLALQLRGSLQELLGLVGGLGDGGDIAVALDAEAHHRLAGLGDAFDHAIGPAVLDADHHHGRDVRVGAGADERAEEQVEVGAELQAAVSVRQRQGALDIVGDRLARGVRQIVERQDRHVIANADPPVLAPPALEPQVALALAV